MENLRDNKYLSMVDGASCVYANLTAPELVEKAVLRGEGVLTSSGALRVATGKYTGRSPNDKFIVETPAVYSDIAWGSNKAFTREQFSNLYNRMKGYLKDKETFTFTGCAGADEKYQL